MLIAYIHTFLNAVMMQIHLRGARGFMPAMTSLTQAAEHGNDAEAVGLAGAISAQHTSNHLPIEQPHLKS